MIRWRVTAVTLLLLTAWHRSAAPAAAQAYELTVGGGPQNGQTDGRGFATYDFTVKALRDVSSTGILCVTSQTNWEWATAPTPIPQLNSQTSALSAGTIRARGTWTEPREAQFFAVLGNTCPTTAGSDSNVVVKLLASPPRTYTGPLPGRVPRPVSQPVGDITDKIKVEDFSITPVSPQVGQATTLRVGFKYIGTAR